MSKIKVLANSVPGEGSFLGSYVATFCLSSHMALLPCMRTFIHNKLLGRREA